MINEFTLEGFSLGDYVKDRVDGHEGEVIGLVVHRYNASEAKVENPTTGKAVWRPLGRLDLAAPKSLGVFGQGEAHRTGLDKYTRGVAT